MSNDSETAWHRRQPELPCPECERDWLRFRPDGMTAACMTCARIFGAFDLAHIVQARLEARRAIDRGDR